MDSVTHSSQGALVHLLESEVIFFYFFLFFLIFNWFKRYLSPRKTFPISSIQQGESYQRSLETGNDVEQRLLSSKEKRGVVGFYRCGSSVFKKLNRAFSSFTITVIAAQAFPFQLPAFCAGISTACPGWAVHPCAQPSLRLSTSRSRAPHCGNICICVLSPNKVFIPSLKQRKDPKCLYSCREPEANLPEPNCSNPWSVTALVQHTKSVYRRGWLVPILGETVGNGIQMSTHAMLLTDRNEQHSTAKLHVGFSSLWWTKSCFYMKDM